MTVTPLGFTIGSLLVVGTLFCIRTLLCIRRDRQVREREAEEERLLAEQAWRNKMATTRSAWVARGLYR